MTTLTKQFSAKDTPFSAFAELPAFSATTYCKLERRNKGIRLGTASNITTGASHDSGATFDFNSDIAIHNMFIGKGVYKMRTRFRYESGVSLPGSGGIKRDYFAIVTPSVLESGEDSTTATGESGSGSLKSHGIIISITGSTSWAINTVTLSSSNDHNLTFDNNNGMSDVTTGTLTSAITADTTNILDVVVYKSFAEKTSIVNPLTDAVTTLGTTVYDINYEGYARLNDHILKFNMFGGTVHSILTPTYFVGGTTDNHSSVTNSGASVDRYTIESSTLSFAPDFDPAIILDGI